MVDLQQPTPMTSEGALTHRFSVVPVRLPVECDAALPRLWQTKQIMADVKVRALYHILILNGGTSIRV